MLPKSGLPPSKYIGENEAAGRYREMTNVRSSSSLNPCLFPRSGFHFRGVSSFGNFSAEVPTALPGILINRFYMQDAGLKGELASVSSDCADTAMNELPGHAWNVCPDAMGITLVERGNA